MAEATWPAYSYDNLDEQSVARVKKELNENPAQIHAHIESFRRWVRSMPHIQCPLDDHFLLRFLRVAKFDHSKAQKRLDNFCTIRSSTRGFPEWFMKDELDDSLINEVLTMGMQIYLGTSGDGENIFLVRPGCWDPDKLPMPKLIKVLFMGFDVIAADEKTQANGICVIIDLSAAGSKQMANSIGNKGFMKNWARALQDAYPIRLKGFYYYKEPVIFDIVYKMMEFFLNEKLRKRIHRVKDNFPKIIQKIAGSKPLLPTEYGGTAGSIEECRGRWEKRFKEHFANGIPLRDIAIDETKRPASTLSYMKAYGEYTGESFGTAGTYTKFDV